MNNALNGTCISPLSEQWDIWEGGYCAINNPDMCCGICPNTDISGLGVRLAFYVQSIMNVILVCVSPEDSTEGAWSATLLTIALIVPAMLSKYQQGITLHHATIALNFATFSSLASLAVAPRCSIWRREVNTDPDHILTRKEKEEKARLPTALQAPHRGRVILSVALLLQVTLQWIWAIILFTHPWYAQAACNGDTILVFFGVSYTAHEINHGHYAIWPLWLIFSLLVTFVWGVILVFSSASAAHDTHTFKAAEYTQSKRAKNTWYLPFLHRAFSFKHEPERIKIWIGHFFAFAIGLMYLVVSEVQINKNNILAGENQLGTFGSVAALLLAVAPAWSVVVALYKLMSKSEDADARSPLSPGSSRKMRFLRPTRMSTGFSFGSMFSTEKSEL